VDATDNRVDSANLAISGVRAMKLQIVVYQDEDGAWIAECPSVLGCVSQGVTRGEAVENVRDAVAGCLEVRRTRGMPLTTETEEIEVAV
jgi:predicted RNase H-like HicB family nuclease